jgi:hypothetical protein
MRNLKGKLKEAALFVFERIILARLLLSIQMNCKHDNSKINGGILAMVKYERIEISKEVFGETLELNDELTQGRLVTDEEWSHSSNGNAHWLNEQGEIIEDEDMVDKLEALYFERKLKNGRIK